MPAKPSYRKADNADAKKDEKKDAFGQIKDLEDEIAKTPYNKRTQHHIGLIKAKIAMLREKQEARVRGKSKGHGYSVRKSGDGTVILVGYPSVGKSTLLNSLTGSKSEVGAYAFTTLDVVPGVMNYNYASIQILDVPGIVRGAASGRGRGREVLAVARSADLVVILIDALHPEHYKSILKEVRESGLRINARRPDVKIVRTAKDGIRIGATVKLTKINKKTVEGILRTFKTNNADVVIRDNITVDQFIDCIEDNKIYLPAITVVNKADLVSPERLAEVMKEVDGDMSISANEMVQMEDLRELIFERLDLIRIFCKEVGKNADLDVPLIMYRNTTVKGMCDKLHKDFVVRFKFAKVWGKSSKFPGQKFLLKHTLEDGDIVELHIS